jgi:hypothetical protein
MSTDKHSHDTTFALPEWAYAPLQNAHKRLLDEVRFLHLSVEGLHQLARRPQAIEVLRDTDVRPRDQQEDYPLLLARAKEMAAWVNDEASRDFPLLHAHSVVGIWGILETLSEDVAFAWLSNKTDAWTATAIQKLKVPIGEYELLEGDERKRLVISELSRTTGGIRNGVANLMPMLDAFGIAPVIRPNIRKALHEMYQVRNVIVHCGSRADARLLQECPWIGLQKGETVRIGHRVYAWYQRAAARYVERVQNQVVIALGGPACTCAGRDEVEDRPT